MNVIIIRRPNHSRKILRWLFLLLCAAVMGFLIYLGLTSPKIFYRIVDEQNVAMTGYRGKIKNAVIQSEYRGIPVTFVYEQAFKNDPWLETVKIPGSVQWIDYQAFYHCENLREVILGEGVEQIWDQAFAECVNLVSITFPSSLITLHDSAFAGCVRLETVTVPEGLEEVGEMAFMDCGALRSFTFPTTITDIYQNAFLNCASLSFLGFPENGEDSTYRIYDDAFRNCTSLTEVRITSRCIAIGEGIFSGCSALEKVEVPFVGGARWVITRASLFGYIFGTRAFSGGVAVEQTSQYEGLYTAVLPATLTDVVVLDASRIGYGGFSGCHTLQTVTLNATLYWIEAQAFAGCTNVTIRSYASAQPGGWVETWNPLGRPVVYGITD